jgi:3-phosphoshikimate 1-carboxyvinyltransferase
MKLIIGKSRLKGTITMPASKSHTIRAVSIASLAAGESLIRNPLDSGDTQAAVTCYRALGAKIDASDTKVLKITGTDGQITAPQEVVDVGNSGTTLRIAMGSAALAPVGQTTTFTGDEQIQSRPIGPLMKSLEEQWQGPRSSNRPTYRWKKHHCCDYKPISIKSAFVHSFGSKRY